MSISQKYYFRLVALCTGKGIIFIEIIFQKIYSDFELQGVMEDKLNSKAYQTISQRMQTEEATCALTMGQNDREGYI